jgi:hypothetical protein
MCCGQTTVKGVPWWKRVQIGMKIKAFASEEAAREWMKSVGDKGSDDVTAEEVLLWRQMQRQKEEQSK